MKMSLAIWTLILVVVHPIAVHDDTDSWSSGSDVSPWIVKHYHPISAISTEKELFTLIGCASNSLITLYLNGDLFNSHEGVAVAYHGLNLHLFNLTREMQQNPFYIAREVVSILCKWYDHVFYTGDHLYLGKQFDRRHRDIFQLTLQLRTFPEVYDINSFQILSNLLDILDGHFRKFTGHKFPMFQRWLFHEEYLAFISNGNLKIVNILGTGSQAYVYAVKSQINQHMYALKLFKRIYQRTDDCLSEEIIMERINQINDKIPDTDPHAAVPRLITLTDDGISINCAQHQAFMMVLLEKKPKTTLAANGVIDAMLTDVELSELSSTIEILARHGISHNDVSISNVLHAVDGFKLIDFGMAVDLSRGPGHLNGSNAEQFYSPGLWFVSTKLISTIS